MRTSTNNGLLTDAKKTKFKGIYTKDTKRGLAYIVRFTVNKKTFTQIVGYEHENLTLESAYLLKLQLIQEHQKRLIDEGREKYQFLSLFIEFLDYKKSIMAKNTYKNYKSHYNAYFKEEFVNLDVRDITTHQLQKFINKLLKIKRPATVEKIKDSIKVFYRYLRDIGIVTINPARQVQMPRYDNQKYFILPKKKVKLIYQYISSIENLKVKLMFLFLLHGRRISEVLSLKWSDIDLLNGFYKINYENSKNRKNKYYPLQSFQIEVLKIIKKDKNIYVFENEETKKPYSYTFAFREMKKLKLHCDIPQMTLHSFRHLLGFLAINKGISLEVIAELLGHSNIQVTSRYAKLKIEESQKAFNKVFVTTQPI